MSDTDSLEVRPEELRLEYDPAKLGFECTDELVPLSDFVGQDRAVRSLQFGLGLKKPGYNIFVTGLSGTGKATAILEYIKRRLDDQAATGDVAVPDDWCYVYNFDEPDRPNVIRMPAGEGKLLRNRLDQLLESVKSNIDRRFSSEEYERSRKETVERGQAQAQKLMEEAQSLAEKGGFLLRFAPTGVSLVPLIDGKPMSPEQFQELTKEQRDELSEREKPITETVNETGDQVRTIERDVAEQVVQLDRDVAEVVLKDSFEAIEATYRDFSEVSQFLFALRRYALENVQLLRNDKERPSNPLIGAQLPAGGSDPFLAFRCNAFVNNLGVEGPPIVVEPNPNWTNLFGRIERRATLGTYVSDHTLLKAGAVHKANGGYLILNLVDLMTKPGAWDGLKRLIRAGEVSLEDPGEQYGFFTPQTLRPEPIPVDVKLVVTGDPMAYFLLSARDEEFWEMFKVKADFDYQIERTQENILAYAAFICASCEREELHHFDAEAVARVVDYGSRVVDDREKLSARFGRLRDVVIEADYWRSIDGARLVSGEHVDRAIDERVYRLNLIEERMREMIANGTIIIDTGGSVVGQVNGLSVLKMGDFSFGKPARITANTFLGQRGVVSIDRESQLSGKIHDKGVLVLSGYLGSKYAQDKPLSLLASISFEQEYQSIDGDSASLAELCAILSSLAEAPIRQDLAMTGSVNQKGEVQPIGGLNQKIEGFYDVCRIAGFTGTQGVMIPVRNKRNLMPRKDVLESVERGDFHVYAVDSVDEAIELLTGETAGERDAEGKFPEGTINQRVDVRLREMGETLRRFGRPQRPDQDNDKKSMDGSGEPDLPNDEGDPDEPKPGSDGGE
ncbi:MAG: AAA family ATPase [Chloroflexi bacterium]|nr:AAA family ATPase [Chloroflexota bacterium]